MAFFGLFKRVKNQSFDFKPRYYDPDKEAREERLKRYDYLSKDEFDAVSSRDRIRSGLRSRQGYLADAGYRSKEIRRSNFRLLAIICVLVMTAILFLYSNKLDGVLSTFLK